MIRIGEYAPMEHGFPRNYIDITPQEILYDPVRVLGSPCTMGGRLRSSGRTILVQPRLETTAYTMGAPPEGYGKVVLDHTDQLIPGDIVRIAFPFGSRGSLAFGSSEIFTITRSVPGTGVWFEDESGDEPSAVPFPIYGRYVDIVARLKEETAIRSIGVYRRLDAIERPMIPPPVVTPPPDDRPSIPPPVVVKRPPVSRKPIANILATAVFGFMVGTVAVIVIRKFGK